MRSIPTLESWKHKKPAYVEFVRIPVIWGPVHQQHAKLFYTLQALDRADLHPKVFDAIHRDGNMPRRGDRRRRRARCTSHSSTNTASPKRTSTRRMTRRPSPTTCSAPSRLTASYAVASVPLMIVNGKYSTSVSQAGSTDDLLSLINDLAASERQSASVRAGRGPMGARRTTTMLSAFVPQPQGLARFELRAGAAIPGEAIWLDLLEPTPSEEKQVESFLSHRRAHAR